MTQDSLRRLNLNLLTALDALLTQRNVTRAATAVGIGQSAMSTALGQLRDHFGDELLIRTQDGMRPTPRAIALEEPLRSVLRQIRMLVAQGDDFDPATAERTFRISIIDGVEMLFVPRLLALCRAEAPGVRLDVVAFDRERYASDLDADHLEIAVGFSMADHTHHRIKPLYRDHYVVLYNPKLLDVTKPIKLKDYVRIPHVVTRYRGTPGGAIDDALAAAGKQRTIVARTPRFLVVPELVQWSPVLATISSKLANICASQRGLTMSPMPLKVPDVTANMVWHSSYDTDPGHRWLRSLFARISDQL